MFNAIIIDDEPKAARFLNSLIDEFCDDIDEVYCTNSALDGLNLLKEHSPELLFLDINMPEMNGFELLDKISNYSGKIILTTAHSDFALKAFKYSVFDYLVKPINVNQLIETIERAVNSIEPKTRTAKSEPDKSSRGNHIAIHDKGGMIFLDQNDIFYVESIGNYSKIHCEKQTYISSKTTKIFETSLNPDLFIRVHRSYIVNIKKVDRYSPEDGGSLILSDKSSIPVSRRKRKVLYSFSVK